MKKDALRGAEKYTKEHQRKKRWYRVVTCLACVVVFCTVYALILPAITLEKGACEIPEHTHSEACYTQVTSTRTEPVCTIESLNLHQHDDTCYDSEGNLTCGYADFVVHRHDSSCYDEDENLWCPLPEIETHEHTDSCYAVPETGEPELICDKTEVILHEHTSDCFDEDGNLICGKIQVLEHQHTDACFETVEEPVDADTLTCTLPEDENHTHGPLCYGNWELTCGMEEHTHSEECQGTEEALEQGNLNMLPLNIGSAADPLTKYAIVGTETIETTVLTADGETYKITVNYTKEAEIPEGSELVVREILRGTTEYEEYRAQTQEALGTSDVPIAEIGNGDEAIAEETVAGEETESTTNPAAYQVEGIAQPELTFIRLFDISIMNGDEEVEPKVPVEVVITYVEPVNTEGNKLDVIHFTEDGVEVLDNVTVNEDGTEITYDASSFSVYGTAGSSVGEGEYIIYKGSTAMNYQNNGNLGGQPITNNSGTIFSPQDNVVWTFTSVTGGYRISFTDSNGTVHYLIAEIPKNKRGTLSTTTNVNDATTVWNYSKNHLYATSSGRTRYLELDESIFRLDTDPHSVYLAKKQNPATVRVNYVDESGNVLHERVELPSSTPWGTARNSIHDIVLPASELSNTGVTYHNTFLNSTSGQQINAELRAVAGGGWSYQNYGYAPYYNFSGDTDIYVVYGEAYEGSGAGGPLNPDTPEIDTPQAGKLVTPNSDGTFKLELSITGKAASGSASQGANVILVYDVSSSMVNNKPEGETRLHWANIAADDAVDTLLGQNDGLEKPLVEMTLVTFAGSAFPNNTTQDYPTKGFKEVWFTNKADLKDQIDHLSTSLGTNWEAALREARRIASAKKASGDKDPTYVIFVTDGEPSYYVNADGSAHSNTGIDPNLDPSATGAGDRIKYFRDSYNYMQATDEARGIVQDGNYFYTLGIYGTLDVLGALTNFAHEGRSIVGDVIPANPNPEYTGSRRLEQKYFFPSTDTDQMNEALANIAKMIKNTLNLAGVEFEDGIATDVTHTALTTNVGSGSLGGVTYTKSGGTSTGYTVTVDSGGNATFKFGSTSVPGSITNISYKEVVDGTPPTERDANADVYAATYDGKTYYMPIATVTSGGDFDWDLSPLTLEEGATYKVAFTVWPDQDAYDYVTNLNNGISGYTWDTANQGTVYMPDGTTVAYYRNGVSQYPNIVKYPDGSFAALSNTYQTADYYIKSVKEEDGTTTTTYEKGDPIALGIPDPMVLKGTNFTVTKNWDDSLDPGQLQKLIADAAAEGKTYSVTLNLKEDGESYKSYTFEPVLNSETGKYEWPSQSINIAPALLTSTYPGGGTYKKVTIDGTEYYVLNEGHEYELKEENLDSHFEFVTETYHPALVNNVLMNVSFEINDNKEIIDGSTATIVGDVPLTTFAGINTLKGGINIYKTVVDEDNTVVDDGSTFKVQVALDHINQTGQKIWFDTYEVDEDGAILTLTEDELDYWLDTSNGGSGASQAEAGPGPYYEHVKIIDAEKGIYKNADGVLYGVNGKVIKYDDEKNYIGSGGYGNVSGYTNVLDIQDNWMIRIVNVLAGTTYEVTETQTNGMQPSYRYWHDNASSDEHIVIGNAASNIRITNKIVNRKVIVYKTDDNATTPKALADAEFTINGTTLTSGQDGYTAVIELPTSGTPYDLIETEAPAGYNKLTEAVKVTVSSSGVTYQQGMGQPQPAEKDADGNYVVHVTNNSGHELPNTGGPGTLPYTLGGIALIMASALVYGFRMRRRERRLN